ncbi:MAG TPA: four helix bundle protein [Kiritimatiellia bacterium]|nr:four helix bundle protein [Kiritimatiellia bacterium]
MGYRNKNRGYQQLTVWSEAISYYADTYRMFRTLPYELRRVVSQQMASVDSIHRNIAEGYCRRGLKEYVHFLYIALSSLGESVSGICATRVAGQLSAADAESLDRMAFKLENGMLKLIESLESKQERGDWIDHLVLRESNETYETAAQPPHPNTPSRQHPTPAEVHSP